MFRYCKAKIRNHDSIFVKRVNVCMYSVKMRRVGVNIFAGETNKYYIFLVCI
jgi:hypothetical protein